MLQNTLIKNLRWHNINSKKILLLVILFSFFATALLSPIGSIMGVYDYLPANSYRDHVALTIQAKMAIEEGQFPIKISPWQHQGLRYPAYQFYSVLPFFLTGYIYKIFCFSSYKILHNPFNAVKIVLWFSIILSGIYSYYFSRLFTKSHITAILAASVYLFAPYLNFNINLNGDFTEAFAQCILPMTLYYSFKNMLTHNFSISNFICMSLSWFVLLISHLITFAYTLLFFSLVICTLNIIDFKMFKKSISSIVAIIFNFFLAAWYVVPIFFTAPYLAASGGATGKNLGVGLRPTSIMNLIAIHSEGLAGSHSLPGFSLSIGWPIIISFFCCCYLLFSLYFLRKNWQYQFMLAMVILFSIAVFMTWSWINIWQYLPYFFSIGEFGHRFFAQSSWLGLILFIIAMNHFFGEKIDARYLIIGLFIIGISSLSWIIKPKDGVLLSSMIKKPDIYNAWGMYLVLPERLALYPGLEKYGFVQLPLLTIASKLILDRPIILSGIPDNKFSIVLKGKFTADAYGTLIIKMNDNIIGMKSMISNEVLSWNIPVNSTLLQPKNTLKVETLPQKANEPNVFINLLPMDVDEFRLVTDLLPLPLIPLDEVKPLCKQENEITTCMVDIKEKQAALQLPAFYYPKLLQVWVDGKLVNYDPSIYQNAHFFQKKEGFDPVQDWVPFLMTTIKVSSGIHHIKIRNHGIHWANQVAAYSWVFLIIFCIVYFKYHRKHV